MYQTKLKKFVNEAGGLTQQLLYTKPKKPNCPVGFPTTGGIYIIYSSKNNVFYVGKAMNLRRRICTNHMSKRTKDIKTAFQRSVNEKFNISFGPEMKTWVISNCRFAYLEITDPDMRSLVETLLIASLRSETMLNKY